ncbi:MAG: N-glycosylase/DNA lyase [Nanoarchaeota archaeon]
MKELKQNYLQKKKIIRQRLKEFSDIDKNNIFYEICFCLLTPQSNAYKCDECIQILKQKDFLYKNFEIKYILKDKTRFYKNKSNYLKLLKKDFNSINKEIEINKDNKKLREYLVKNVKGLGYKEASHVLRNLGFRDLAILDRHILRNLEKYKVIKEIPRYLNKKSYLSIEEKFYKFSKKINIPMDELDLLFWSMQTGKVFK